MHCEAVGVEGRLFGTGCSHSGCLVLVGGVGMGSDCTLNASWPQYGVAIRGGGFDSSLGRYPAREDGERRRVLWLVGMRRDFAGPMQLNRCQSELHI